MLKKTNSFQALFTIEVILINHQFQKNRYFVCDVSFQTCMKTFSAVAYRYSLKSHEQFHCSDASKAKLIDTKADSIVTFSLYSSILLLLLI